MNRTVAQNSVAGLFVDENPGASILGTRIEAADLNAHQEEIVNAILAAGLTPSAGALNQLAAAIGRVPDGAAATTDANTITKTGAYYFDGTGSPNLPVTVASFVIHSEHTASNRATQIWTRTGTESMYYRRKTGGAWGSWTQIWTANDAVDAATINGSKITTELCSTSTNYTISSMAVGETKVYMRNQSPGASVNNALPAGGTYFVLIFTGNPTPTVTQIHNAAGGSANAASSPVSMIIRRTA